MRNKLTSISSVLLVLMAALLMLAVFFRFFSNRFVDSLPGDFSYTVTTDSSDNFYDEENGEYSGEVASKAELTYQTESTQNDLLFVKNDFTVTTLSDSEIFSVSRDYTVNKKDGSHSPGFNNTSREGYLFAPKNVKKDDVFTYWHVNYDAPATMKFIGEETLSGLVVYKFEADYSGKTIDQTEQLKNLPGVPEERGVRVDPNLTLWIEPTTGWLVKYEDQSLAYYYDSVTNEKLMPWNSFSNVVTDESVKQQVSLVQSKRLQILFLQNYLPLMLTVLGLLVGVTLLYRLLVRPRSHRVIHFSINNHISMRYGATFGLLLSLAVFSSWWLLEFGAIDKPLVGFEQMNPITALLFGLAALPFMFVKTKFVRRLSLSVGLLILLVVILRLLSLVFQGFPEIDLLIFRDAITSSYAGSPARMSPATTGILFLIAEILILCKLQFDETNKYANVCKVFAIAAGVISVTGLYVHFTKSELNVPPFFYSLSVPTALLGILGAVFLFAANYSNSLNPFVKSYVRPIRLIFLFSLPAVITIMAWQFSNQLSVNNANQLFEEAADEQVAAITRRLEVYRNTLISGEALFEASEDVSREEWSKYVAAIGIEENYPGLQGLGYARVIKPEEVTKLEDQIRSEGYTDFRVFPENPRDIYTSIIYLEPFDDRNKLAFGYDMFSESTRREAMEMARDSGKPFNSGRVTLLQEGIGGDVQAGFLMYVPHYGGATGLETPTERRDNIAGYVYSPFRMNDLVGSAIEEKGQTVLLEIYDKANNTNEDDLMYRDEALKSENFNKQASFITSQKTIYNQGRPWTVVQYAAPGFGVSGVARFTSSLILIAAGLVVGIITVVILGQVQLRKKAQAIVQEVTKDLQKSKETFENAFRYSAVGLAIVSTEGRWIRVNRALLNLTGYEEQELLQKTFQDITHPDDLNKDLSYVKEMLEGSRKTYQMEKRYKHKNGYYFWILLSVGLVRDQNGKPLYFVSQIVDINKIKEVDKAKTEFVSLASHQLRTPLSSINWYSEMLLDGDVGKVSGKQKEYLEEVYTANKRMVQLIDALLNVSRLELGTFSIEPQKLEAKELADQIIKELMPSIKERKLQLTVDFSSSTPHIIFDEKYLSMIFQNLLSNAIKYTPEEGKIHLRVSGVKKSDSVGGKTIPDDGLLIIVQDTGYGIPVESHSKVFTKLYRADNVRSKDTDGTGLGLYIIKSVIDHSKGKIWFRSEKDKGTTFYVYLPLETQKKEGTKKLS